MKKLLIAVTAFFAINVAMAQQANIMNAWDAIQAYKQANTEKNEEAAERYLKEAKNYVDKAVENPSTSGTSKAWKYQGDVYNQIFTSNNPRLLFIKEGSREVALDAYIKALTVQKRDNGKPVIEGKSEIINNADNLILSYNNSVIRLNNNNVSIINANAGKSLSEEDAQTVQKNNEEMVKLLELGYNYSDQMYKAEDKFRANWSERKKYFIQSLVQKAASANNGALLEKYANIAIEEGTDTSWFYPMLAQYYEKIGAKEQQATILAKGKVKYPKDVEIFIADAFFKLDEGKETEAMQLLAEGKVKFPDQKATFTIEEVNYYLGKGNFDKAKSSLEEAIEIYKNDPADKKNNSTILKTLYFNAGVAYTTLSDTAQKQGNEGLAEEYKEKAISYYNETTNIDPKYVKAYNQIAAMLVDEANIYTNEANKIPIERGRADDRKKYDALMTKSNALYERAAAELEKAYAIEKTSFLRDNLMNVYVRLKNMKRLEELDNDKF